MLTIDEALAGITSANLAAQIRLQYKGDNAYYTAITPTAMNTLSQ